MPGRRGSRGLFPTSPAGPRVPPASGLSPCPESDGEGAAHEEIILMKTPASSHLRWSTGSDPHLFARMPLSHCQN